MNTEAALLSALHEDPDDEPSWLALADWLEEEDQSTRADLVRLRLALRQGPALPERLALEERVRELILLGADPCVPEVVNSVGMRLALVPAGTFLMGSPDDEEDRFDDEGPVHPVQISTPFYMGVYQVTQGQYQAVMGRNPSQFSPGGGARAVVGSLDTSNFPVESVSWDEAVAFCARLSRRVAEQRAGRVYRLPTEAEWEYTCRADSCTGLPFHYGPALSSRLANFDGNSPYGGAERGPYLGRVTAVGSYRPNAFGLFDMHGNLCEWCADWFDDRYYASSPPRDPQGPEQSGGRLNGRTKVLRGGSWVSFGMSCRAAFRYRESADFRGFAVGFRVVMTA